MLKLICLMLVWTLLRVPTHAQSKDCKLGWFGSDCQYKCHCDRDLQCTADGQCPPDVSCQLSWFGPACQFLDVAYNTSWTEATDGSDDTCLSLGSVFTDTLTLTLTLRTPLKFTWLRVLVNSPEYLKNFTFQFRENRGSTPQECHNLRTASVSDKIMDLHCDLPGLVQIISLSGEGVGHLCSVYVSAGRNVALKQATNHSSQWLTYSPDLAVDGITDGDFDHGSCSSTSGGPSVLNVTLKFPQNVNRFVIYNRDGSLSWRLKGFTLKSFDDKGTQVYMYTDRRDEVLYVYSISPQRESKAISRVEISVNGVLTLCEVELYGDSACSPGQYGRECEGQCNCADHNEACFVSTGGCPSGCAPGYRGDECKQMCMPGMYGFNCNFNCSEFCLGSNDTETSACHNVNGSCYYGCQTGYTGATCTTAVIFKLETMEEVMPDPAPIVGGVVAGVVIIILLLVLAIIFYRRHKHPKSSGSSSRRAIVSDRKDAGQESSADQWETEAGYSELGPTKHTKADRPGTPDSPHIGPANSKSLYYNTFNGESTTAIAVTDLESFVSSKNKSFYQEQFAAIPSNDAATVSIATSAENKHKNRYKNIYAYDHSRVHLQPDPAKNHGDYINASYIQGYKSRETFIASQGPTKVNLEDFVRMLWEQEVDKVVMLTNVIEDGKQKCEVYWPEESPLTVGDITIHLATTQVFANYTIRRLQLRKEGKPAHTLTHFHFTSWPDKDVPTTPWGLVDFEQRVGSYATDKAVVVHCSAGVGRTGTFIALRNLLRQAEDTGLLDFYTTVKTLRHDRVSMVQTAEQYEFLFRAVQVAILCMGTTVTMCDIEERMQQLEIKSQNVQTKIEKEFKSICAVCDNMDDDNVHDSAERTDDVYENSRSINKSKNRLSNILPKEFYRAVLSRENTTLGDYINAVLVPSFTKHDQQILTQLPLPVTVVDFWRLVTLYKVSLVVAFERDLRVTDQTIADYLPTSDTQEATFSMFRVKFKTVKVNSLWRLQQVTVTVPGPNSDLPTRHHVTHLECTDIDLSADKLLTILKEVRSLDSVGAGRILYMCRNGAEYSGLVCILSLLLDRMENDQCLTVPLVVGAIKAIRPQVIPSLAQYRLLYQVLNLYSESANEYSNFSHKGK